jgi:mRNA-degrading endonuclease RelE of RelBE toxin-antitoxin system
MEFRIADTFTGSLTKLTGQEQKAVKTTAFDLQIDPANPGMKFHKLSRAKDPNFWSVRVNQDIRIIVHRTVSSFMLCYVNHHDEAYKWAERRKIERHPKTGAAQLLEIRERVEEIVTHKQVEVVEPVPETKLLFADIPESDLLSYGVPEEWIGDVQKATENTIFELAEHLPQEASEALLDLATGCTPQVPAVAPPNSDPFSHPDAQRRFRVLTNVEELERALEFPWEKWTVFLHPSQKKFVENDCSGPTRIAGSAGTGKTIVALHRTVYLARSNPKARVLLTTFSNVLANSLKTKLIRLVGNEPSIFDRISVYSIFAIGHDIYTKSFVKPDIATPELIKSLLKDSAQKISGHSFSPQFLLSEWNDIVDAWQLKNWEDYRDVTRLGRKTRIGGKQREILWSIFEDMRNELNNRGKITWSDVFGRLSSHLVTEGESPFDFAVIDEAQDIGVAPLRFISALGSARPNGLFFSGDLGQRIFQTPFSWKTLGVDIRGRSHTLRINYRTSHQIRSQVDKLLPHSISDVDGNLEGRRGAMSVFNGPPPIIKTFNDAHTEATAVGEWVSERLKEGFLPNEIGVFVRSDSEINRAKDAVKKANADYVQLDDNVETSLGSVAISTMHLAKGLEFRAVVVMCCDDEVLPLQERIETVSDESDLEEVYNTERHLLYVACTRARDQLLITGVKPASEFLDDLNI